MKNSSMLFLLLGTTLAVGCSGGDPTQPETPAATALSSTDAGTSSVRKTANEAPIALFRTTPPANDQGEIVARPPVQVAVNMCGSKDPDVADTIVYDVDFGDGARYHSRFCRTDHTYPEMGRYLMTACVSDGHLEDQAVAQAEKCEKYYVETRVGRPEEPQPKPKSVTHFTSVQTNVPVSSLSGWRVCFSEPYETRGTSVSTILGSCPGETLIMACRDAGSDSLKVAAMGGRTDVTSTHVANDVSWHYDKNYWGYGLASLVVSSTNVGPKPSDKGLSWNLNRETVGTLNGGGLCGLGDGRFERVMLSAE